MCDDIVSPIYRPAADENNSRKGGGGGAKRRRTADPHFEDQKSTYLQIAQK